MWTVGKIVVTYDWGVFEHGVLVMSKIEDVLRIEFQRENVLTVEA